MNSFQPGLTVRTGKRSVRAGKGTLRLSLRNSNIHIIHEAIKLKEKLIVTSFFILTKSMNFSGGVILQSAK
jgi:hypothetical protein